MHFFGRMAHNAAHIVFAGMDISLPALTQIFIADPAAVAGNALVQQIWPCLKLMPVDKATAHRSRPADMTPPASGVAFTTMELEPHVDGLVFIFLRTTFQDGFKSPQGSMQ